MDPGEIDAGDDLEDLVGELEQGEKVVLEREKHEMVESKLQEVAEQLRFLHEEIGPKD